MRSLIQCTEAFELSASISEHGSLGYHLKLIGFIPSANHPEEQVCPTSASVRQVGVLD